MGRSLTLLGCTPALFGFQREVLLRREGEGIGGMVVPAHYSRSLRSPTKAVAELLTAYLGVR
jgi:hypothetical protein